MDMVPFYFTTALIIDTGGTNLIPTHSFTARGMPYPIYEKVCVLRISYYYAYESYSSIMHTSY